MPVNVNCNGRILFFPNDLVFEWNVYFFTWWTECMAQHLVDFLNEPPYRSDLMGRVRILSDQQPSQQQNSVPMLVRTYPMEIINSNFRTTDTSPRVCDCAVEFHDKKIINLRWLGFEPRIFTFPYECDALPLGHQRYICDASLIQSNALSSGAPAASCRKNPRMLAY